MPRLENWYIGTGTFDGEEISWLCGNIYDDKRFIDGFPVRTSRLVRVDEENKIAETMNTVYELGEERFDCDKISINPNDKDIFNELLKPIKDHCDKSFCWGCEMEKFCDKLFIQAPRYWGDY